MTILTREESAAATHWSVDRDKTSVAFAVKTFWGLTTVHGRFNRFDGAYEVGPTGTRIVLTIAVDSLDTGNAMRDKHLRSDDFFDLVKHPTVRFTSTRVQPAGDGMLLVEGTLEAAGEVVPLKFPATVQPIEDGLEVAATTEVDHRQLGMSSGTFGMIRPTVLLRVKARLRERRQPVGPAA